MFCLKNLWLLAFVVGLGACGGGGGSAGGTANGAAASSSAADTPSGGSLELWAGALGGRGNLDGSGADARFGWIDALVLDPSSGDFLVVDEAASGINLRKLSAGGMVTTPAKAFTSQVGFGGFAVDAVGNMYFAEPSRHLIMKRSAAGVISTVAGQDGVQGSLDGLGTAASFTWPRAVAIDGAGNLYVVDQGRLIRKITTAGLVSTYAGIADSPTSLHVDGGPGVGRLGYVWAIAADASGTLYVVDENAVRRISTARVITTLAGSEGSEGIGHADGAGAAAQFSYASGLVVDASGNLYVGDGDRIRKMTPAGVVTTIAGGGTQQGDGMAPTSAQILYVCGLGLDAAEALHWADCGFAPAIRKVSGGVVATVAGVKSDAYGLVVDGIGGAARFFSPDGMAVDASGNLFVADPQVNVIWKILPDGTTTLYAGQARDLGQAGIEGTANGDRGIATFSGPSDLTFDPTGNLFVVDWGAALIRKITPAGVVSTFAGMEGVRGSADGPGASASFEQPSCIRADSAGNLYVTDSGNHTIRKITSAGVVSTYAGRTGTPGRENGAGTAARFNSPEGLDIDSVGNLYVADRYNNQIRKIAPGGIVTTLAGSGSSGGADGLAPTATFDEPRSVAVDLKGNVFVADSYGLIRKISSGSVATVVGVSGAYGTAPGPLMTATLDVPRFVIVLPSGQLAISVSQAILKTTGASF